MTCAICQTFPNGSRTIARRSPYGVSRGSSSETAPAAIARLFESNERYRHVNEVGISFNGASTRYIHTWPAASNEVRPGVHLGLGGAANPNERTSLIHLDCMAANCAVLVNGHPFLSASS